MVSDRMPLTSDAWDGKEIGRCSVIRIGETYWMWYAACNSWHEYAVGLAHSSDGVDWRRFGDQPVLKPPSTRRLGGVHSFLNPWVMFDNGQFHMVVSTQGARANGELWEAISDEGASWSRIRPVVIARPNPSGLLEGNVTSACVVSFGGRLHMFCTVQESNEHSSIIHATLQKPHQWVSYQQPILECEGHLDHVCVHSPGQGSATLWCTFESPSGSTIMRSTSNDGDRWEPLQVVISPGSPDGRDAAGALAPCVVYEDGGYVMWHLGWKRGSDGFLGVLLRAVSTDGMNWLRSPQEPVLYPGPGLYVNRDW